MLSSNYLKLSSQLSTQSLKNFNKYLNIREFLEFYSKNNVSLSEHYLENSVLFSYVFFIKKFLNLFFDYSLSFTVLEHKTIFDFGAYSSTKSIIVYNFSRFSFPSFSILLVI